MYLALAGNISPHLCVDALLLFQILKERLVRRRCKQIHKARSFKNVKWAQMAGCAWTHRASAGLWSPTAPTLGLAGGTPAVQHTIIQVCSVNDMRNIVLLKFSLLSIRKLHYPKCTTLTLLLVSSGGSLGFRHACATLMTCSSFLGCSSTLAAKNSVVGEIICF